MTHLPTLGRGARSSLAIVALMAPMAPIATLAAQEPSSSKPRIFAEGIVSTSDDEFGGSLTPNGDTIYFSKSAPHSYRYSMLESHRRKGGGWSTPTMLPFSGRYTDSDPTLSPDGTKMFWTSDRPVNGKVKHDYDLWMVERTSSGSWGAPQHLPEPINSNESEFAASMTRGGTLYFSSARDGGIQAFRSHIENGVWTKPENVTRLIEHGDTATVYDLDVMIDPDERFLLLGSVRQDGFGNFDLYIAWNDHGKWSHAVHLPAPYNTRARDYAPHLSPDGHTLFFSSERGFALDPIEHRLDYRELTNLLRSTLNGSGNIYQLSADALDAFHPAP
jgi:WD40-like Beta Propeller Repeat